MITYVRTVSVAFGKTSLIILKCDGQISHMSVLLTMYRYSLMSPCWRVEPSDRPTFSEIIENIKGMLKAHEVGRNRILFLCVHCT